MKNLSNKHKIPAIIIITLLIASVIVLAMPSVKAQEGVHGGSPNTPVTGGPLPR
jgi:flagellar biosynthesis/type III secretory pathway M-ring protein FliF/YscJ